MKKFMTLLIVGAILLTALPMVSAQGDLGSEDNPIQVYFVPSVEAQAIVSGGEVMANALHEATGMYFEVFVPTSYAATIEAMCAAPDSSMGFIPAAGFVLANNRCGVEVGAAAVRYGWPVYWAEYIVRRDSDIYTFGDLAGRTWGYGDPTSTSGYIVPSVEMAAAGIEVGDTVETGGHNQTVLAVYNGEVDFGTVFFSPPQTPGAAWDYGDLPEPYDLTVDQSYINDAGRLYVGDVRVLDARASVRDTAPDIVDQVRILRISAAIPNDTLSFGPGFPVELRDQIIDALTVFTASEACAESICSPDFYEWTGIARMDDSAFDSVRLQFEILGLTEEDIFAEG
ncbi:MAG: phosphate/phosphite/phosphonate ABC transporter substrate-binding protein [Anaerolineae bacterium]|nr:phosphate/phosphite/phosphonate ABC transporter substrate-binding protein [Anaerolineae bacterium]